MNYLRALPGASIAAATIAAAGACAAAFLFLDAIDAAFGTALAAAALFIAAVDLDRFEVPDIATLTMFVLGLAWTQARGPDLEAVAHAVVRSIVVAGVLFGLRAGYRAVRNFEGLGLGDVKLAGAGAVWLPFPEIAITFLIAIGAAFAVVLGRSLVTGERIQAHAALPFGTFLAPAIWISWFAQVSGSF